jgi:hypothetical protein
MEFDENTMNLPQTILEGVMFSLGFFDSAAASGTSDGIQFLMNHFI